MHFFANSNNFSLVLKMEMDISIQIYFVVAWGHKFIENGRVSIISEKKQKGIQILNFLFTHVMKH